MNALLDRVAEWFFDRLIERLALGDVSVAVMNLQPNDIIVVKSDKPISDAAWDRLTRRFKEIFPNNLVFAVEDSLELAIVRARAKVKETK